MQQSNPSEPTPKTSSNPSQEPQAPSKPPNEQPTKTNPFYYTDMAQRSYADVAKDLRRQIQLQKQKRAKLQQQSLLRRTFLHRKQSQQQYQTTYGEDEDLQVPVDGDIKNGSRVYMVHCSNCHSLEPSVVSSKERAPAMGLLLNRRAGSDINYIAYSKPMLEANFYWTPRNLFRFMDNPKVVLESTYCRMGEYPLKSESDRADLIEFLREYEDQLSMSIKLAEVKLRGYQKLQTDFHVKQQTDKIGKLV